ncbi:hypothetical protein [Rhodovulum sulfidophilum]|uniref:hypothetical protein n=1 Tax=Rhodovulum sulfidophilum TaxID=35806 RepID=UPI000951AF0B|nr:hypothetical protein [Rhodovulum sulfidophilum]MBL3552224.1 hypothetical protein [Rhodovulum sulfidophilum]OLS46961.1 hypothetical protein BV379_00745 [Rhodovulum sulfidophilum]
MTARDERRLRSLIREGGGIADFAHCRVLFHRMKKGLLRKGSGPDGRLHPDGGVRAERSVYVRKSCSTSAI